MHDGALAEERGLPSVTIISDQFVNLAAAKQEQLGFQRLPQVVLPHPFSNLPPDMVAQRAQEAVAAIVCGLTVEG